MNKKQESSTKKQTMFSLVFSYRNYIAALTFSTIIANLVSLAIPKIISHGIDSYTNGSFNSSILLIEFSVVTVLVFVFTYIQNIFQTYASEQIGKDLREQLILKISQQNYAFIQKVTPATVLTNLTSDVDAVKMFAAQAIGVMISSVCLIIGASILLLITNWQLGLIILLIIPIIAVTFSMILKRVRKLFVKTQKIVDQLNKVINESILGAPLIRVLYSQKHENDKFIEVNTDARNLGMEILSYFAILIPVITFVASMAVLIIVGLGGHYVISGSMTLGDLAAFNSYLGILIFPIIMIGFMSGVISRSSASYERIYTILGSQKPPENGKTSKEISGDISVSEISLVYGEKNILKNINIHINPGSRTAIIGPTAAGKTQLLYVLHGLIEPTSGTIQYNGIPIQEFDPISFHRQVGFVFQDSIMFNASIRENIAFSEHVTDEDLQKAVQTAELEDFIQHLPQGYDTVVSERGTTLSGGQKQRIMLARALALRPQILLLDDFTARVDTKTEQKILSNVSQQYPDITLISVTQKIASVVDYDQIILLMEGEIIASGTHTQLMESSPEYVQLFESQHSTNHYELQS